MKRIVVIDNYDSFTYNLVHALDQLSGGKVDVFRNDRVSREELEVYDSIVLSPGPGIPEEAGSLKQIIEWFAPSKKILGVCLGHQAIAEVFGGRLININKVFHGVSTMVQVMDKEDYIYKGIPELFDAGRYHSWIVAADGLPECFSINAVAEDGEIMGISHKEYDIKGVQFHPESVLTQVGEQIIANWINN
jgi:anthranilate synthase component 2